MSPADEHAYFGLPPMFPSYDEVHISVTFTWDIDRGYYLKKQWEMVCDKVNIGGVAFNDPGDEFVSGRYLKAGCVITSRGCPNNCLFCLVPKREGKIRELEIKSGNNILDNNLLACSKQHIEKVFEMLKNQRDIKFSGGIEAGRVKDNFIDMLRGIKLLRLYLAFDYSFAERSLKRAVGKLSKYFKREQLGCYVLIGWNGNNTDTIEKSEERLIRAWELGVMPFAMLYRPENYKNEYSRDWKQLQRTWSRPAATKARMKAQPVCNQN